MVVEVDERTKTPRTKATLLRHLRDEGLHLHFTRYGKTMAWTLAVYKTKTCGTVRCLWVWR